MTNRLTATLREAPATIPALATLALFIVWSTSQAGYPGDPLGALAPSFVLALLGIASLGDRPARGRYTLPVKIALGALAGYTALGYLSILWAGGPGDCLGRSQPDAALPARVLRCSPAGASRRTARRCSLLHGLSRSSGWPSSWCCPSMAQAARACKACSRKHALCIRATM